MTEDMLKLAARCEAATADQQATLLSEAFYASPLNWRHKPEGTSKEELSTMQKAERRFRLMLDAEAYESAAMTLVPEGWRWAADNDSTEGGCAYVWSKVELEYEGRAATPALALCAAALKARASQEKDD